MRAKTWNRILAAVVGALALVAAARFFKANAGILSFPFAVNYGEGVVLDQARRIAEGEGLYRPIDRLPFAVDNYTPLYPYLSSLALPATGVSFFGGRVISFVSILAAAILVALIAARGGRDIQALVAGLAGAGIFLAAGETLIWGALCRVDDLGVALALGGFAVAASGRRAGPLIAAPIFLASLATLQSLAAAPAAAYGALFLSDRRRALWGASVLAALIGAGAAAGALATEGRFLLHTVVYNALPFERSALWAKYALPLLSTKGPLLAAGVVAAIALRRDPTARPLRILAGAALLVALSIGRRGADVNYLLLPITALAALAACGIGRAPKVWQRRALAVLAAAQIGMSLACESPRIGSPDLRQIADRDRGVLEALAGVEGPILFEEPSLAVLSRRPVEIEPFMAAQLAAVGRWDPAPAVEAIRDRRYDLIQRTAFIIAPPGEDPIRQRLRDRTVPAIDLAIEDAYAPGILPSFVREAGRNRYEEFSIWFPKPEDDEPRGADPPPSDRRG